MDSSARRSSAMRSAPGVAWPSTTWSSSTGWASPSGSATGAARARTSPPSWGPPSRCQRRNPQQSVSNMTYDLIVVGEGVAGLTCAAEAARLGLKVATFEAEFFGGLVVNVNELQKFDA